MHAWYVKQASLERVKLDSLDLDRTEAVWKRDGSKRVVWEGAWELMEGGSREH